MTYTPEQLTVIQANNPSLHVAGIELIYDLKKVLDSPKFNCLCNGTKAGILLILENDGEYDPLG